MYDKFQVNKICEPKHKELCEVVNYGTGSESEKESNCLRQSPNCIFTDSIDPSNENMIV